MNKIAVLLIITILVSCTTDKKINSISNQETQQFTKIHTSHSNIDFKNTVKENNYFNFLNYSYIYNGGGVAVGDINGDGLVDVYFTSNQQSNKLYLNKGNFIFEDITKNAKVGDEVEGWTTGVTMVDINNDGFLDIYVCKSGLFNDKKVRANKLFVNQKDTTFKEEAELYGIADPAFSTQAYFFDMDNDGDLDMYLVNHRPDFNNNTVINLEFQKKIFRDGSDQLYRNDNGKFKNISEQAGILNKAWGLSASVGDFNNDGWQDIYVSNDFLEPDFLYINNQNGTFSEQLQEKFNHISSNSMGSDFADINNDLHPDLLVLDMTPEDHIRSKSNMPSMSTENFDRIVKAGYHYQYMQNTLQLNNGNGTFSEIAQLSGIAKTDWSWAPLIADFDNDGLKDVFVTNGILHELNNQDFRNRIKNKISNKEKMDLTEAVKMMPSEKLSNYIFKNNGDLTFKSKGKDWGLDALTYSNGAVYADLDNDGDLDLLINNIEDKAGVYKNNSTQNYLQIQLLGTEKNILGIGAKVIVQTSNFSQSQIVNLTRGFQSSIDPKLTFGIGNATSIDSVKVIWPNGKYSELTSIKPNQLITIGYSTAKNKVPEKIESKPYLKEISPASIGIGYKHQENDFDDFKKQILLPHSESKNGPFITTADVNSDGLEDFFIGGAKDQTGELYIQKTNGTFKKSSLKTFTKDRKYEDLGVLFFDVDNDNDQDLYIVSGGAEHPNQSKMYQDRLYLNDGQGNFNKSENSLPEMRTSGQVIIADDVDNDGDLDIFVGGRIIPDQYPYSPKSYLLINDSGTFKKSNTSSDLNEIGLITSAIFTDYDKDGDNDLIAVGEWTKIQIFENNNGQFSKLEIPALEKTAGLWFSIAQNDMDGDGDLDYFIGNLGLNSKFKAKKEKPFKIYCDDFDGNGTYDIILAKEYKGALVPLRGKECTSQQMPFVNQKFETFKSFAEADLGDILGENNLESALQLQADLFYSVYLENKGNGNFSVVKLPNQTQISPILSFEFVDLNKDGTEEIICFGNLYHTEVETVRYDASFGSVMRFNKNHNFSTLPYKLTGLNVKGDSKNSVQLKLKDKNFILITNNNDNPKLFQVK